VVLEMWGDDGDRVDPQRRRDQLVDALGARRVRRLPVAVDFSYTQTLIEIAGPIVAWEPDSNG
jgi:hypothetical protein